VREPLTVCFGGGGIYGIAFNVGVGHAFRDSGLPFGQSPMVGTSAGSWAAATMAVGTTMEELIACWKEPPPNGKIQAIEMSSVAFGDARSALVTGVAVRVPTFRRHLLSGFQHSLADVVAASSSAPGYVAPHIIGPLRFIDGGVVSNTSANKCVNADLLVVVTPVDRQVLGPFGRYAESAVRWEIAQWRQRNGGQTLLIRPSEAIAKLAGKGSAPITDMSRAEETYEASYRYGVERAERFLAKYPRHAPRSDRPEAAVAIPA